MLKAVHIDSLVLELDAFQSQTGPLLVRGVLTQLDLAAGAQHAMPRQLVGRVGS